MTVELICVGTELLLGNIVNTNAAYISEKCAMLGLSMFYQSVVGDNERRLEELLKTAKGRSDVIILCGGLGPTQDDLTKETAAKVMGRPLVEDKRARKEIEEFMAKRSRNVTENNWKQALVPKDSKVLYNPNGTAPGIIIKEGEQRVILLPGPPNELIPMFVGSFILNESLGRPELRLATYLILYVPPLVLYMIWNCKQHFTTPEAKSSKKTASMNLQLIDAGIMNGFETLAKLGGYIILFAILAQMTTMLPISHPLIKCLLIGCTEITNGISYTARLGLDFSLAYPLMVSFTAFGGLSGFAQTASMVKDSKLSMIPYLQMKLLGTAISVGLALLLTQTTAH